MYIYTLEFAICTKNVELVKLYSKEKADFFCLIKLLFIKVRCLRNVGCNLGLRYFWRRGNIRKGFIEREDWGTSVYFVLEFQGNSMQSLSVFCFLVVKVILKALFSFIPWLLNFSDLPFEEKVYTKAIIKVPIEEHPPSYWFPLRFP